MSRPLDDLPTLRDFRDQLVASGVAQAEGRRSWAPRRLGPVLIGLTALALAASAAAATLVGLRGTVIPGPAASDVAPQETIVAGSARVLALRAPDPVDGTTWTLRASRSRSGERCLTIGQRRGGAFGLVGLDGRFRLLAPSIVDGCAVRPARDGVSLLGARVFDGHHRADVRTVVYGLGGALLRTVELTAGDARARVRVSRDGTFAWVVAGYPEDHPIRVVLRFADGRRVERSFGRSRRLVTGSGAARLPALQLNGFVIDDAPTTECLSVAPARQVDGGGAGPAICGSTKPARPFGAVRAVRPGRHGRLTAGGYDWGRFPARTLVYGRWPRSGPALRSVVVHTPTGTVQARIQRRRTFLAVLPAGAQPARVSVTVVPRGGAPVTFRGSLNLVPNPLSR